MNICELIDNNNDYTNDENNKDNDIRSLTDEDDSNDQQNNQNYDENFDDLSILEKFFRLCDAQKFDIAIKYILAALECCTSHDEYMRIFAVLRNSCFYNDIIIRSMWIEQIPNVVQYYQNKQILDENIKIELSIIISNLMQYTSYQVRKIASAALLTLVERNLIEINKIEQYIIPCLLNLVNENNDDIHIECVSLFGKLAPLLGRELTVKHLLVPFSRLCASPVFHTRKVCATNIGEIAVVVSNKEVEESLLPHFYDFTKDQVWAIRKVCAEIFSTFANKCTRETRETVLTECFINLLEDNSRWVKISAYKTLGSFIATFFKTDEEANINKSQTNDTFIVNESQNNEESVEATTDVVTAVEEEVKQEESAEQLSNVETNNVEKQTDDDVHEASTKLIDVNNEIETDMESQTNYSHFLYWRDRLPEISLDEKDELLNKVEATKTESDTAMAATTPDKNKVRINEKLNTTIEYRNDDSYVIYSDYNGTYTHSSSSANNMDNSGSNLNSDLNEQNIVPPKLLGYFITMVDMNAQISLDSEMNYNCAFNFPAIAYTLGASYWKYLKELYVKLAEDVNWKVRQTLAYSIHELANILGMEITQTDLVPIFDSYIKDVDEVRIGIVTNLSKFLKVLDENYRRSYLPKLVDFLKMDNHRNWRFRNELALQTVEITELYSSDNIAKYIQPIAFTLALDKVAEVRSTATKSLAQILRQFVLNNELTLRQSFVEDVVRTFAHNDRWSIRQLYIVLCSNILLDNSDSLNLFSQDLLPQLLLFRNDKVPNIRLCLARLIAEVLLPIEFFTTQQNVFENQVQLTIEYLRNDTDNDVNSYFETQKSLSRKPSEIQQNESDEQQQQTSTYQNGDGTDNTKDSTVNDDPFSSLNKQLNDSLEINNFAKKIPLPTNTDESEITSSTIVSS